MAKVQTVPEEVVQVPAVVHHKEDLVVQADQTEVAQAQVLEVLVVQKAVAVAEVKVQLKQVQVAMVQLELFIIQVAQLFLQLMLVMYRRYYG